jgi:hypothetical protein
VNVSRKKIKYTGRAPEEEEKNLVCLFVDGRRLSPVSSVVCFVCFVFFCVFVCRDCVRPRESRDETPLAVLLLLLHAPEMALKIAWLRRRRRRRETERRNSVINNADRETRKKNRRKTRRRKGKIKPTPTFRFLLPTLFSFIFSNLLGSRTKNQNPPKKVWERNGFEEFPKFENPPCLMRQSCIHQQQFSGGVAYITFLEENAFDYLFLKKSVHLICVNKGRRRGRNWLAFSGGRFNWILCIIIFIVASIIHSPLLLELCSGAQTHTRPALPAAPPSSSSSPLCNIIDLRISPPLSLSRFPPFTPPFVWSFVCLFFVIPTGLFSLRVPLTTCRESRANRQSLATSRSTSLTTRE